MKSIKLRALFLGVGLLAFSSIFAQDTPSTPKPDTAKSPKPDTTGMVNYKHPNATGKAIVKSSFVMINDNKPAAKLEGMDDRKII